MAKYKIQYLSPDKLTPNPDNPRLIKDANFKKLVKSLKDCPELFDARPCICSNRTGDLVIWGGNMRYRGALELKYDKIPVVVMEGLTEAQEREIAVKDNVEFGEWEMSALQEWKDLPLEDWGLFIKEQIDLEKKITSEEEYIEAQKTADQAIDAMTHKIKKVSESHPERLNGSMAVVITNGRGNDVLFLSDPNTSDIVKELMRLSEQGESSPLDALVRQL